MYLSQIDNQQINNRLSFSVRHFDTAAGGRDVVKPSAIRQAVSTVPYRGANACLALPRLLLPPVPPAPHPSYPSFSPAPQLPHPPADQQTTSLPKATAGMGLYWELLASSPEPDPHIKCHEL